MTSADCLMLDAKQAILEEHHRRFQVMHHQGRLDEAMRQVQIILSCSSDLLNDSLRLLDQTLDTHGRTLAQSPTRPRL